MFSEITRDLKGVYQRGSIWSRVILLCIAIFLVVNIIKSYFVFASHGEISVFYLDLIHNLSVSTYFWENIIHPWVWLTHIFLHEGLWHLIWNMVFLYWFSMIVDDLIGRKHSLNIFFQGALAGALLFLLSPYIFPWYSGVTLYAQGASAAVTALLFASATIAPDYSIRLLLLGNIPLKYLALAILILDLLFASQNSNSGGHLAHIGGAGWGWFYIYMLRSGNSLEISNLFGNLFITKPKKSISLKIIRKETNQEPLFKEERLNQILDKIKINGIQGLTEEEKSFLDKYSS
ncbi:MAG: rhomboid family intramembrane serine protease [Bacteroidota bacterium]|nr:rhomboid family intramembrane serine protease [Bacteroidota bacterium]